MSDSGIRVESPAQSDPGALSIPSDASQPPANSAEKNNPVHKHGANDKTTNAMGNQQGSGKDSSNETHECCIAKSPKRQRKERLKKKGSRESSPIPYFKHEEKQADAAVKKAERTDAREITKPSSNDDKCSDVDVSDFVIVDTNSASETTTSSSSLKSKPVAIQIPKERDMDTPTNQANTSCPKGELSSSIENAAPPPPSPSQLASFCEEDEEIENEDDYMEARSREIIDDFGNSVCQRLSVLVDNIGELGTENMSTSKQKSDSSSNLNKPDTQAETEQHDSLTDNSNRVTSDKCLSEKAAIVKDSNFASLTPKSENLYDTEKDHFNPVKDDKPKDSERMDVLPNTENSCIVIPESPTCRFVPDSPTVKFIPESPTSAFVPEAPVVMRKVDKSVSNTQKTIDKGGGVDATNKIIEKEKSNDTLSDSSHHTNQLSSNSFSIQSRDGSESLEPTPMITVPKSIPNSIDDLNYSEGSAEPTKRSNITSPSNMSSEDNTKSTEPLSKTCVGDSSTMINGTLLEHKSNMNASKDLHVEHTKTMNHAAKDADSSCGSIKDPVAPALSITTSDSLSCDNDTGSTKNVLRKEPISSELCPEIRAKEVCNDLNGIEVVEEIMEKRSADNLLCAEMPSTKITHSVSDEFNNNVSVSKDMPTQPLSVRPGTIQNDNPGGKSIDTKINVDDQSDSNVSSGELSTPCNESGPTAADIFAQTDSDSYLSAVESDKNRQRSMSEKTSSNDNRHDVNRPILEMPELDEASTELEELHVIFRKNQEKIPDINSQRPLSLRSPPDFFGYGNGRRSRASDCLSRTESDLDLSEQRDDISTDGIFGDDEDECEVLMCKTYTEPEQGAEVLLSCTIVNSAYKENQRDSFWSDNSSEDLKQTEKTDIPSTTPAFRDARQQMKDIHLHLQNLRMQMEQLNDDLAADSNTSDEYLSFSDTKRPITN